jgi:hypothetical protein
MSSVEVGPAGGNRIAGTSSIAKVKPQVGRSGMIFSRRVSARSPAWFGRTNYRIVGISTEVAKASSPIRADDQERRKIVEQTIRIDHAGEYGAVRIYEGQVGVSLVINASPEIQLAR